jgi:5-oxoprolinase (ATP-hydrolysing) subunit B
MGPLALLLETDDDPVALAYEVGTQVTGLLEVVPAARTVLVVASRRDVIDRCLERVIAGAFGSPRQRAAASTSDVVRVPVRYDGADLADVAASTGLTIAEVRDRHAAPTYRVGFCGFAPGFAYLEGLDPGLHLPRRATPRTRVPPGSVAIAAAYTSVYPTASPGGWHLVGSTAMAVWDAERSPPALLAPGTLVRFEPSEVAEELGQC